MFLYSKKEHEVFVLHKNLSQEVIPKVKVDTKLLRLREVAAQQWRQVRKMQGSFSVFDLKCRYGSSDTYILLAYVEQELAHIEWIVPYKKIKSRYHFVSENSYSIISCLTSEKFRGLGIYPGQIQAVVKSDIPTETFWIWATSDNSSSLSGIRKAGGIKVGVLIQKKWFRGCISSITYFSIRTIE